MKESARRQWQWKPGAELAIIEVAEPCSTAASNCEEQEGAMNTAVTPERGDSRWNFLILCMDQWDTHMDLPEEVRFPALESLQARGVTLDRQYCAVPICTPSRATMWTGVHAKHTGLWDNTNFAWIDELSAGIPTIGHLLREQGYYTAFKG